MRLIWQFDDADLKRLGDFTAELAQHPFVKRRRARNVRRSEARDCSREEIWRVHLGCLLTTQQRSGAGSSVNRLLDSTPFPLRLPVCIAADSRTDFIRSELQQWGGIRFSPKIAVAAAANLTWLEQAGWDELESLMSALTAADSREDERNAARWVARHLKGIGPKQSRNLLQWLGLTKYEIPLDSRVIRWANDFGFPVRLSAAGLSDEAYYEFVLDGVQQLCEPIGIFPCELDAMIFARFEPRTWRGGMSG